MDQRAGVCLWKKVEARAAVVQQFLKMSSEGEPVEKLVGTDSTNSN